MIDFYRLAISFIAASALPILADFLIELNRITFFSPVKNSIALTHRSTLKREIAQFFVSDRRIGAFGYGAISVLLGATLSMSAVSFYVCTDNFSSGAKTLSLVYALLTSLSLAASSLWISQKFSKNDFPHFLGFLSFRLSCAVLMACYVSASRSGSYAFIDEILFFSSLQFLLYFSHPSRFESESSLFSRHCEAGGRIFINVFTFAVLGFMEEASLNDQWFVKVVGAAFIIELLFRLIRNNWPKISFKNMDALQRVILFLFVLSFGMKVFL